MCEHAITPNCSLWADIGGDDGTPNPNIDHHFTDRPLAAKGGVIALSKAMAVSLADAGIRVLTDEVAARTGDPRVQAMLDRSGRPLGRGFGEPGEFASVVRFLVGPEASYVNGTVVVVDGGASA